MAQEKSAARNELKLSLARLGLAEIAARSAAACGSLVDRWSRPGCAMAYLAMPVEADAAGAIAAWRARGVRVCVPRADWATRSMEPAVLGDRVVSGPNGIREAAPGQPVVGLEELEVVVVPGLGFTPAGERLGRGGGFYDRFLARLPAGTITVGLAVSDQMRENLPTEPTDRLVDWIVTEDGAAECRPGERG